jgi:protein-S-isoprenylcysteine O-methyltransferase Ste14
MPLVPVVITVICLIALIGVVLWFVQKVAIPPPMIYVVYAGIAILCILVLVWIMNSFGGGVLRL